MSAKTLRGSVLCIGPGQPRAYRSKGAEMENRDPRAGTEATSIRCPSKPTACRTMKKSNTKIIALPGIEAGESTENLRHLFFGNSDSGVVYVNPDARPPAPTTHDYAPPYVGVPDRIAY